MNSSSRDRRFAPIQGKVGAATKFPVPAPGRCMPRFVGYYELGDHTYDFQGISKQAIKPRVRLEFELVGDKHPPFEFNGQMCPLRVYYDEALSMDGRSNLRKIFDLMRGDRDNIEHFVDMLGEGFIATLEHSKSVRYGQIHVYGKLKEGNRHTIRRPFIEENGEMVEIEIPPAITAPKVFSWAHPTLEEYEAAPRSVQQQIRSAVNFKGSPIYRLLEEQEARKVEQKYERPRRFE